ncbi:MAG TPA: HAMP domain-containing sensor histidine kinase, partial [Kiloniellaceae bacterium]|nr:HAMP domain-containing sensor histidine kinase [Kiloniellaceae bacterium]
EGASEGLMDPFVIIKALHIAVLVIIGGALCAFWHQSDRKNPFLLHWSIYEVALAAILFATGHPPFSQIAAGVAVSVLLLGTLHYRNKQPPPRAAFVLLFLAIAVPAYGLGQYDSAYGTVYLTTAIGIAYMATAALFVREGGWLNVFIGVVFVGRTLNALLYQVWVTQDMLYMVYVTGQVLATLSGVGLLLAGFARAYGQLQQRERELIAAYNQSEELMLRLELRNEEYLRARHSAESANAAKTQFLANMSHELRTPLNAILGFSEVMMVLPKEKVLDKVGAYARNIHDAATGLQTIISDILNLSRVEAGALELQPEACDLGELLEEIRRLLQPLADQKEINLLHEPGSCVAWCDRRLTRQALINGVSNAIKYTQRGGRVVCRAALENGFAVASVEDNGIGIDEARLAKVFEPFWQEGNTFLAENTGVGLGLSIAKSYVEAQGGRIELKSALDRGTLFRVHMPLAKSAARPAPPAAAAAG